MNVYWKTILTFVVTASAIIAGRTMGHWTARELIDSARPVSQAIAQPAPRPAYTNGPHYYRPANGSGSQVRSSAQRKYEPKYDRGTMR